MSENKQHGKTLVVVALVVIAIVGFVRHFHIKNFHTVVLDVLYTSGQPRGMDYTRLLYKYHIATFVNVRIPTEHREQNWYNEEITWVRQNGLNYIELPVPKRPNYFPDGPTQDEFLKIMGRENKLPVLLHDSSGRKRVSMLSAVWLIKAEGYSADRAVKVVEKIKEEPVTDAERKFIQGLAE